ncbi:MAG: type IV pilin protein [Negativicutes bacterium]|nr:type IV pilin protein [Negativicutes bacterium]
MFKRSKSKGFSLIELMITVAIIGILAAIALPSYQSYIARSNRAEAREILLEDAQFLERYYTENNKYTGAILPYGVSPKTGTAKYTISATSLVDQAFTLSAAPTGVMTGDGCGNLTLTSEGVKSETGTLGVDLCWGK